MSTNNPTDLRIGMKGQLLGHDYRICGRVVLSTDIDGERYYWQEFFLKSEGGEEATLVFEEDENGPAWRFFQYFEPQAPFSIVDLSRVNVGDNVGVDDFKGTVNLIGKSTVRAIEGEAPEGVERGDYSQYFNAIDSDTILVVSWANGEVEHYIGQTITRSMVRKAFAAELPANYNHSTSSSETEEDSSGGAGLGKIIGFIVLGVFALLQFGRCAPTSCSLGTDFSTRKPPAENLAIAKTITAGQRSQRVVWCAFVEYATASFTRRARMYGLVDEAGKYSQLFQGIENDEKKWVLWDAASTETVSDRTPQQLATLPAGASVTLSDKTLLVSTLFRLRVLRIAYGEPPDCKPGKIFYGFIAKEGSTWRVVRWDEQSARIHPLVTIDRLP